MWTGVRVPVLFTSLTSSSSSLVIHWFRKGPATAERNVRGWPAESTLRTGAPADVESRREAGARRLAAKGEGGTPAERGARKERGVRLEVAGEESPCTKREREKEGESKDGWGLVGKEIGGEDTEKGREETIGFGPKRRETQKRG